MKIKLLACLFSVLTLLGWPLTNAYADECAAAVSACNTTHCLKNPTFCPTPECVDAIQKSEEQCMKNPEFLKVFNCFNKCTSREYAPSSNPPNCFNMCMSK
jgi:hypothetical protein